jgi:hypothetical protein
MFVKSGGRSDAVPSATERSGGAAAELARRVEQVEDDAEPDLIGSEVNGRYRVIELIGEGGMGKVYFAEHVEIGKRVALEVLHPSYSRMPDLVEQFRREARAASKIGHPNIVNVTDSGTTTDGSVYFARDLRSRGRDLPAAAKLVRGCVSPKRGHGKPGRRPGGATRASPSCGRRTRQRRSSR